MEQATNDAATMIVNTAISMLASFDSVFIVEGINLLIMGSALAGSHLNVYFPKPGSGKVVAKIHSP